MSSAKTKLHKIAKVTPEVFQKLEKDMKDILGKEGVVEQMEKDVDAHIEGRLDALGLTWESSAEEVIEALTEQIKKDEDAVYDFLKITREDLSTPKGTHKVFDKIRQASFNIATEHEGYFLKKEKAEEILRAHPPEGTIEYLHYANVEELLEKEDIMEIMSALRFTENEEWMHKAFDVAYSDFTFDDFEKRSIELRVLSPQWKEIAEKFVAKKHHNVSHLKEFGVIFLNPINQGVPGALMRDFTLFFHYFHEIAFYSRLFEYHSASPEFAEKLKSFLRGDVPEKDSVEKGEWLIVQRYLWKVDPNDPRLFLPRVNPESLHWRKGEDDAVAFGEKWKEIGLEFWDDLDWVAGYFKDKDGKEQFISFDLEDTTFSLAANSAGDPTHFNYHQQEALWNEAFRRYVGKEERYKLILKNFDKGSIKLE
ncbi:MAG: hypothetical protein R3346_02800 [Candidatus Spechtbacterales bacterium]|nr:hypothetical protein [Candidatus Spechtbacterales bacterium]